MSTRLELHHDDCRVTLRRLIDQGVRVHSVVTDPPYHLESIVRRFGKPGSAAAQAGSDGRFARQSKGFMGRAWDGADADGVRIAQDPEFWELIYEILLPGGYVLAFSSPKTGHWQACAMEIAGFVMHPFIGWAYGQGFPKAHSLSKAIDGHLGAEREVVSTVKRRDIRNGQGEERGANLVSAAQREGGPAYVEHPITKAATLEAAVWEGWFYGTQSLKPALEPIYVGQRPFDQKNGFLNVLEHGVGALNIEECRTDAARWPANLLHDDSDVVRAMFPNAPGQLACSSSSSSRKNQNVYGEMRRGAPGSEMEPRDDAGSAARFFNSFPFEDAPLLYQAKATKLDRAGSSHPTVKPVALMRWLCRLATPPGGIVLDPFAGSGTTGKAALDEGFSAILIEREDEYVSDIRKRFRLQDPRLDFEALELIGVPADLLALI
jgi:site-specific DNA-methyltransferase (adenine-specific)